MLGPPEAELNTHVAKEKLGLAPNGMEESAKAKTEKSSGDLYLTIADQQSSALYKLSTGMGSDWSTLSKRNGQFFFDMAVWGTRGPITEVRHEAKKVKQIFASQLLIVESKMGYLHKFSVRGDDIAQRQTLAVVEKPACIAVDDEGILFVQVRSSSTNINPP